jgi:hypothetical protein
VFRLRLVLTTTLLMVALTSLVPAAAGGPTSALLSVPGEGRTASIYYTDAEYEALAGMVGIESATGVGTVDRSGTDHAVGPGVTVTWLIHDVTPWRVDHIYLEGKGAPWIATQLAGETGSIWDDEAVWHQPGNGAELASLLDKLGVAKAARDAGEFTGVAGAPVAEPEPAATQPATGAAPAETSGAADSSTGLWWGLAGLLLGVLVTALWMRPRRASGTAEEPTVYLDDGPAEPVSGVPEELSWPTSRR